MLDLNSLRRRRHVCQLFFFAIVAFFAVAAPGQSALDGFDPNANGPVRAIVVQPDGKILIGGDFTTIGGVARNSIARLNADGTLDTAFNPNANGGVYAIAIQADGKIIVGGQFSGANSIGGQTRNFIARLDATTGAPDSFDPNASAGVFSIAVQSDGKILVGGQFNGVNSIGGQLRNFIARLDALSGAADSFNPNASFNVRSIAVQLDGKILVGGQFNGANSIGGATRNRIARLDATTGVADSFDPNANDDVYAVAVQSDGKIVVGGFFTGSIGGQARNRIARLDATTGLADSWNPNANNAVVSIAVQPDGKVIVGGLFNGANSIGGQTRARFARLDAASGLADSFNPSANNIVFAIAVQSDGKILAGGFFTGANSIGGQTRNHIARLERDGLVDRTLDLATVGSYVVATAIQPDGKIIIGGLFTSILGTARNRIARLNTDGTLDTAFNPNANGEVGAIAIQSDGKIIIGGQFNGVNSIGVQTRNYIARLDAVTGAADSWNPNANSDVYALALQSDGKILVGGLFNGANSIGGQTRNYIARLDATTGLSDSFNPNANYFVDSIAVQSDGKILVGGFFQAGLGTPTIGGQTRNYIARLDATTGAADSFNPNANSGIYAIAIQSNGKILVGGLFGGANSIGGQARNYIARLDATTGLADSFDPNATNSIVSIAVQSDGKILVGGIFNGFNSIGGQTRNYIARLDATTGLADSFNPNANGNVYSIAIQPDGKILVGGTFNGANSIGGQTRSLFARLSNDTPALQDLAVTQGSVTWTRNGSSTQFTRVAFESSTDNVNYTFLGNGTAAGSNWTLTGLSLPTGTIYIRARGYYRSGYQNGSESTQESVRSAFLSAPTPTNTPTNTASNTATNTPTATATNTPTNTPTPASTPSISGIVTYGNAAAPPKYISNATVTGTGSPNVFTTTAAPGGSVGQYALTGFGTGSYTVSLSKTTGQNGIASADAARIAQHVSGALLFTNNNQRVAADVTGNGVISSQDAAKVAQVVAGLPLALPNFTGQWRFYLPPGPTFPIGSSPTSRTYSSVSSNITGDDYVGLLIGEVTGNWNNTGARSEKLEGSRQKEEGGVAVDLPQVVVPVDKEIVVPVSVQGIADKEVISYEFDLRYDPSVIQPLENSVDVVGTASRGLSVVTNSGERGLLRVVVYGAFPIEGDGVLLNLRFAAVGASGSISPLTFERIMFNEGETQVSVADGKVELF